jgi:hypothetical protein
VESEVARRQLSDLERQVVARILSVDLPGVVELRDQLELAEVLREWGTMGPSVDIWLPADCARSMCEADLFPADARVTGGDGNYEGELLLWLEGGRLSALEYAWVTDDPPVALPSPDRIQMTIGGRQEG